MGGAFSFPGDAREAESVLERAGRASTPTVLVWTANRQDKNGVVRQLDTCLLSPRSGFGRERQMVSCLTPYSRTSNGTIGAVVRPVLKTWILSTSIGQRTSAVHQVLAPSSTGRVRDSIWPN